MAAISTRNARVRVTELTTNTVANILATHWTVEVRSDEIDVTNFETGGFAQFLPSYVEAHISVDGFYETGGTPFTNGIAGAGLILSGNYVSIFCYMNRQNVLNNAFRFDAAWIMTASGSSAVRDAARVSFTAKNFGQFFYPGPIAFSGISTE